MRRNHVLPHSFDLVNTSVVEQQMQRGARAVSDHAAIMHDGFYKYWLLFQAVRKLTICIIWRWTALTSIKTILGCFLAVGVNL
jgi:hypothetical protein